MIHRGVRSQQDCLIFEETVKQPARDSLAYIRRADWNNAQQSLLRIAEREGGAGYSLFRCSKPATPLYLLSGLLDNIAEQILIEQGSKR
jgi:hypothetical protein